jgi:hypothetical protein
MIGKCGSQICCNFFTVPAMGRKIFCSTKCNARQRHIENYPKRSAERVEAINKRRREIWANMTAEDRRIKGQKAMSGIDQERQRQRQREDFARRYHEDLKYKLMCLSRSRIGDALRGRGAKSHRTTRLIGCSIEHLRQHLEAQFTEGMTWDNHGEWHIDHIRPCASFDLTHEQQQLECFNYTNLQPLWAKDNLSKGARIP